MARPRKPTRLLELTGARAHDKKRYLDRENEPRDARALGDPPARLPPEAVPYWHEVAGMACDGVLRYADRQVVLMAARLMWKFDTDEISAAELTILTRLLTSMGLDPAARSKLSIAPSEKPQNRFSQIKAG
jgi:phage terminase small subunit